MLVRKGMGKQEVFKAISESGRWEYIASGENFYWFRNVRFGDVVEIQFSNDIYSGIEFL